MNLETIQLYIFVVFCFAISIFILNKWLPFYKNKYQFIFISSLLLIIVVWYMYTSYNLESFSNISVNDSSFENFVGNNLETTLTQQYTIIPSQFKFVSILNPTSNASVLSQEVSLSNTESSVNLYMNHLHGGETYIFQVWLSYDDNWNNCANPFRIMSSTTSNNLESFCDIPVTITQLKMLTVEDREWYFLQTIVKIPSNTVSTVWKLGSTGGSKSATSLCNESYTALQCVQSKGYWCGHRIMIYRPLLKDLPVSAGLKIFFMPSISATLFTNYLADASSNINSYTTSDTTTSENTTLTNTTFTNTNPSIFKYSVNIAPQLKMQGNITEGLMMDNITAIGPPSYILSNTINTTILTNASRSSSSTNTTPNLIDVTNNEMGPFTISILYQHTPTTETISSIINLSGETNVNDSSASEPQYIFKLFGEKNNDDVTFNNALTCFIQNSNLCFVQGSDNADVLQFEIGNVVLPMTMYTFVHSGNGDVQIYRDTTQVINETHWFNVYTWGKQPMLINPKADVYPMKGAWGGLIGYERALTSTELNNLKGYVFQLMNNPSRNEPCNVPQVYFPENISISNVQNEQSDSSYTCKVCFENSNDTKLYRITPNSNSNSNTNTNIPSITEIENVDGILSSISRTCPLTYFSNSKACDDGATGVAGTTGATGAAGTTGATGAAGTTDATGVVDTMSGTWPYDFDDESGFEYDDVSKPTGADYTDLKCNVCFEGQKDPSFYKITQDKLELMGELSESEKQNYKNTTCPLHLFGAGVQSCSSQTTLPEWEQQEMKYKRVNSGNCTDKYDKINDGKCRCLTDSQNKEFTYCGFIHKNVKYACNEKKCSNICHNGSYPNPFLQKDTTPDNNYDYIVDPLTSYSETSATGTSPQFMTDLPQDQDVYEKMSPFEKRNILQNTTFNREWVRTK